MTGTNRPCLRACVVVQERRTIIVGLRSFAPQLVEAVSFSVPLVTKLDREPARIEVRPPLAVVMDKAAVSEFWPALVVEGGEFLEGQKIKDSGKEVVPIGGTAGNIHDRGLYALALEYFMHRRRPGRIRISGRHPTPG